MEAEICEYEEQLAEVRAALQIEKAAELVEVENELVGLIAELKKKLSKTAPGNNVIVKGDEPTSVVSKAGTDPDSSYIVNAGTAAPAEEANESAAGADLELAPRGETALSRARVIPKSAAAPPAATSAKAKASTTHAERRESIPKARRSSGSGTTAERGEAAANDSTFEAGRSKWQQFAQRQGKKKAAAAMPRSERGVSKKPAAARRPHFAK